MDTPDAEVAAEHVDDLEPADPDADGDAAAAGSPIAEDPTADDMTENAVTDDDTTDDATEPAEEKPGGKARGKAAKKKAEKKVEATAVEASAAETKARAVLHLRNQFGHWLGRPMTSFHLIVAVSALLVSLGLIMVLSASGVHSYDSDGTPWMIFAKQVLWTIVGLVAFYAAVRIPIRVLRRLALPGFIVSVILLILVLIPGIGTYSNGSRGWFVVAGFSMQPSELAKIVLAIWGAHVLATRRMEHASLREMLVPLIPAAVIAMGLVVVQPDLGQTVSMSIILLGLLWYAGLSLKVFVTSLSAALAVAAVMAVSAGYRSDRVRSWIDPSADAQGIGYQARQSKMALANGSFFGAGLGQGTAKYNYLPNAHNDFIFAIIGEELGFVGAFGLLLLFGLFAYTGMRIARRSNDPFLRLLSATTTLWIIGQAFINVGYVIGVLPVTGVQLPLISAGGTSTATTLLMIGLMANAARHEPDAVAALRAGRDDTMTRVLRLPPPEVFQPNPVAAARTRKPAPRAAAPAKPAPPRKPAKKRPAAPGRRQPARKDPARREPAARREREPARARRDEQPPRPRRRAAEHSGATAAGRSGRAKAQRSAKVATDRSARAAATPRRGAGAGNRRAAPPAGHRQPRGVPTLEGHRYG